MSNMASGDPMMAMLMQALQQAHPQGGPGAPTPAPGSTNMWQQGGQGGAIGGSPQQLAQGINTAGGIAGYINNPAGAAQSANPLTQSLGQVGNLIGKGGGAPGVVSGGMSAIPAVLPPV